MSISRLRRLAAACRLVSISLFIFAVATSSGRAADAVVSGVVVDPSGRGIPRARVRVLDGSGVASAAVFADESGRFHVTIADAGRCRIEATLPGFQPEIGRAHV